MAKITPRIQSLVQQRKTALQSAPKAPPVNAIHNRVQAFNQERLKRQAATQQTLLAQMNKTRNADETALKQTAGALTAIRSSMPQMVWAAAALTPQRLRATAKAGDFTKITPTRYNKPTILTATPGKGSPGEEIIITAAGISDDPVGKQVLFTVQPMVTIPGKIVSTSLSGGEVVLAVAVPAPQGTPLDYNGQMVLQDEKGVVSNAVPFHFIPIQVPVINQIRNISTTASRTPGENLVVEGANFMPGSHACFIFPWNPQTVVASTGQVKTPLQLISPIPGYSQPKRFMARMFIRYTYKAKYLQGDIDSSPVDVFLDATTPTISTMSADRGQQNDSVLLSGQGFCDTKGEVHFVISPNQDITAPIIQWSDTQILTQVPDFTGIRDSYTGQCYIKKPNGVKSAARTFTFVPAVERKFMIMKNDLPDWNVLFSKGTADDSWTYGWQKFQDGTWVQDASIVGSHNNRFWYNNQGDDLYFWHTNEPVFFPPGTSAVSKLKNGWKVVAVNFSGPDVLTQLIANAKVTESHVGTDDPTVKVHYWIASGLVDNLRTFSYLLSIEIEGPKGMPYK
jgi:hypothetical protein